MTHFLLPNIALPEEPIAELHVWLGITRDGGEAILSADLPDFLGLGIVRHVPFMSTKIEIARGLENAAKSVQSVAAQKGCFIEIELRTFIPKPK